MMRPVREKKEEIERLAEAHNQQLEFLNRKEKNVEERESNMNATQERINSKEKDIEQREFTLRINKQELQQREEQLTKKMEDVDKRLVEAQNANNNLVKREVRVEQDSKNVAATADKNETHESELKGKEEELRNKENQIKHDEAELKKQHQQCESIYNMAQETLKKIGKFVATPEELQCEECQKNEKRVEVESMTNQLLNSLPKQSDDGVPS